MDFFDRAALYVGHNEAFRSRAYWDVNAWRIGYGSDTRTAHRIPVKRHDTTTLQEATDNLAIRLREFTLVCETQCPGTFAQLPEHARIALLDMAYNYGRLPADVAQAINARMTIGRIAFRVELHKTDNHGVNEHRREDEARKIVNDT
jgi:GH24 family phage-related lysozyme (muramidase)